MKTTMLTLALAAGHASAFEHPPEEAALDLEMDVEGRRELFPLMPGTKCPPGHTCRPRHHHVAPGTHHSAVAPLFAHIKDNIKGPLTAMQEQELNNDLNTVVSSA